jgi:hypothetical protein
MGHTVGELQWKDPDFLCIFWYLACAVMEKCCDACGDFKYYFQSGFLTDKLTVFERHRVPLTGSRWDIRLAS